MQQERPMMSPNTCSGTHYGALTSRQKLKFLHGEPVAIYSLPKSISVIVGFEMMPRVKLAAWGRKLVDICFGSASKLVKHGQLRVYH